MTRRAGLIESPTQTAQAPNLSGGAHPAASQAYADLAKAAQTVNETFVQPGLDAATEKRASEAIGQRNFTRTDGVTRQDLIYDKVVDAGFMAQASTDVERIVGELENKHLEDLDMNAFNEELAQARNDHLSGLDSRYAVRLRTAWDQRGLSATQRLSGIATQKGIKRAQEAMNARVEMKLNQVSGASDLDLPDVNLALQEAEQILQAQVATGDRSQEEADALLTNAISKVQANRIADEAVSAYEESGYDDAVYAESIKTIDEAISSTELNLTRTERSSYLGAARSALNSARSEHQRQIADFNRALREAEAAARADFSVAYTDAKIAAGEGFAPDPQALQELARIARATGRSAEVNLAKVARLGGLYQMQDELRGLSIPQQEQAVQAIELEAARGNANAALMLDPARKVAAASRAAASSDPATYAAITEKREVPQIAWDDPNTLGETMGNRFTEAEIAAKNLGVDVKYFSPADRTQLKALADKGGAPALALATTIAEAADKSGVDPLAVMKEIADGGAPLLATAGALVAQGVPPEAAQKILSGKAAMGSELVKDKMPKQSVQAAAQRAVLGDKLSKMPAATIDAITRAADAHYATTLLESDGKFDGITEAVAYAKSMRAVMGEWVDPSGNAWGGMAKTIGNSSVMIPPWIAQNDFPTLTKNLTDRDLRDAVGWYGTLGNVGNREATAADYRSALLIDAGAGRYYVAPDPNRPKNLIVYGGGGSTPLVLDLNRIRDSLKQRAPNSVR